MATYGNLRPQHLRLILKIAECGRLHVAAAALGISQPAASRILLKTEADLGLTLFERNPGGLTPTGEGAAFARHARAVLTDLEHLRAEMESLRGGLSGYVRIGTVTGPAAGPLIPALQAVRAEAPLIEPLVEVAPSLPLVRGLEEGRYHFVLGRLPAGHDSRAFEMQPAREEVVSLVVNRSHPLAGAQSVSLADLTGYEWIMQDRGSPIREAIEHAFHHQNTPLPARITNSGSMLIMLAMLAHGDHIAPLSNEAGLLLTRSIAAQTLCTLPLDSRITVSPYFVIRNRDEELPQAAERVLDAILRRI